VTTTPLAVEPITPAVAYAGPLARYGVTVEHSPEGLVIAVPRSRLRDQSVVLAACIVAGISIVTGLFCLLLGTGVALGIVAIGSVTGLIAAIGAVLAVLPGLGERSEFRVTREALTIEQWGLPNEESSDGHRVISIPLSNVGQIKGDLYAMGLTVQECGRNLHHRYPKPLRLEIATLLRDAVARLRHHDAAGEVA
jgi:hypothetical protein